MEHYDFIFTGGGLAGLSLALQIALSPLSGASILIVDQDAKLQDDRTWGFWSNRAGLFDEIVSRSWNSQVGIPLWWLRRCRSVAAAVLGMRRMISRST